MVRVVHLARFNHLNCNSINFDSASFDFIDFDSMSFHFAILSQSQKAHLQNTQNATQNPLSFYISFNAYWWCDSAPQF